MSREPLRPGSSVLYGQTPATCFRDKNALKRKLRPVGELSFENWVGFEGSIEINFQRLYKDYIGCIFLFN